MPKRLRTPHRADSLDLNNRLLLAYNSQEVSKSLLYALTEKMADIPRVLLDHYEDPFHQGQCEQATHAAEARSQTSGCQLRLELMVAENQQIEEAWFEGAGCEFCEGCLSLLCEKLSGNSVRMAANLSASNLFDFLGLATEDCTKWPACHELPSVILELALQSPVALLEDDLADGTQFGGPSLREEC